VQPRQGGGFYPTRGRVAQSERDKERDKETERECSVVEGLSGVSTGTAKAKVRCAVTSVIQSPVRLRISGPWGEL